MILRVFINKLRSVEELASKKITLDKWSLINEN